MWVCAPHVQHSPGQSLTGSPTWSYDHYSCAFHRYHFAQIPAASCLNSNLCLLGLVSRTTVLCSASSTLPCVRKLRALGSPLQSPSSQGAQPCTACWSLPGNSASTVSLAGGLIHYQLLLHHDQK